MTVLLDTHVFLWWLSDPKLLSAAAATAIGDPQNRVLVSIAVLWEIAVRAFGIRTFILPEMNRIDLEELPPEVREDITFVPASTLEEVLRVALPASTPA